MIKKNKNLGFTIVELLVVVVIIGILASITIVSFTGVSQKATVVSIKSDLSGAANLLRMYQVEYNAFPTAINSNYCPTAPTVDNKYCLKASSGNSFDYLSYTANNNTSPQTFNLTSLKGSISYDVTNEAAPFITPVAPPVSATGGNTVLVVGSNRVHTFTSGGTFSVISGGKITVSVSGGGGGGGACYNNAGAAGGLSSIKIATDTPYVAYGGGGGGDGYDDMPSDNSPGLTVPKDITGVTGGASNGGSGANQCGDGSGYDGGAGGKVDGILNISTGKAVVVVVGVGGGGGYYGSSVENGVAGGPGSVTFTYAL